MAARTSNPGVIALSAEDEAFIAAREAEAAEEFRKAVEEWRVERAAGGGQAVVVEAGGCFDKEEDEKPTTLLLRLGVVQLCSTDHTGANFATASRLVRQGAAEGCEIICLPEAFAYLGKPGTKPIGQGLDSPLFASYCALAKECDVWLSLGGFMEGGAAGGRIYNTHALISPKDGRVIGRYRKLHLFDAAVDGGWKESRATDAGNEVVVVASGAASSSAGGRNASDSSLPPVAIGMSTCYDMRFPELYVQLREAGSELILVPSAFMPTTGAAHWEVLLRSRAIETQCFVVAAAQAGQHNAKRASYGHSLVVSPWGEVLLDMGPDAAATTGGAAAAEEEEEGGEGGGGGHGGGTDCAGVEESKGGQRDGEQDAAAGGGDQEDGEESVPGRLGVVTLDLAELERVRGRMPIAQHRRRDVIKVAPASTSVLSVAAAAAAAAAAAESEDHSQSGGSGKDERGDGGGGDDDSGGVAQRRALADLAMMNMEVDDAPPTAAAKETAAAAAAAAATAAPAAAGTSVAARKADEARGESVSYPTVPSPTCGGYHAWGAVQHSGLLARYWPQPQQQEMLDAAAPEEGKKLAEDPPAAAEVVADGGSSAIARATNDVWQRQIRVRGEPGDELCFKAASQQLTRAMTIFGALRCLGLLSGDGGSSDCHGDARAGAGAGAGAGVVGDAAADEGGAATAKQPQPQPQWQSQKQKQPQKQKPLHLWVLGCDPKEGNSAAQVTDSFRPLCTMLRGLRDEVHVHLVGPNMPPWLRDGPLASVTADGVAMKLDVLRGLFHDIIDDEPGAAPTRSTEGLARAVRHRSSSGDGGAVAGNSGDAGGAGGGSSSSASSSSSSSSSSNASSSDGAGAEPPAPRWVDRLAICFNAGIWGYPDWAPTVVKVVEELGMPLVVTSYNYMEADDDEDMVRSFGLGMGRWAPRLNPYRSLAGTASQYAGEVLCENCYWMAL